LRTDADANDIVAAMNIAHEGLLASTSEFAARRGLPFALFPLTHLDERVRQFYTMRHQLALVQKAEAVFLQTRREAEFYRRAGIAPRDFVQLGPGVNPDEIRGGDAARARERFCLDGNVVLYLGTLSSDKGALTLVDTMKQCWAQGDERTILVFAGAILDEVRPEFEKQSRQVKNRMRVLGVVSEAEKNDLLAACDMLVLPSRVDSFGIVLLEAWLYGKPVIGANAGGIPDVIEHERDGLLVPFGDAHALAQAIGRLLSDSSLAQAFGSQGRAKVLAEHTWDRKYATLRQVYERLVQRAPLDDLAWHES
jgi:glycosyltransferase involved in cell wall biosynthesis